MPISDLLAEITGSEQARTASPSALSARPSAPKRKAENDLRGDVAKSPRDPARNGPTSTIANPSPASRPYTGTAGRSAGVISKRPDGVSEPSVNKRPNGNSGGPSYKRPVDTHRVTKPVAPARPAVTARTPAVGPTAPPKKGTMAEIRDRAARAQAMLGPVGRIQHQSTERRRDNTQPASNLPKRPMPRAAGDIKPQVRNGAPGLARNGAHGPARNGTNGRGVTPNDRNGNRNGAAPLKTNPTNAASKKGRPEEPMPPKPRKAVQESSGYTGRARPTAATSSRNDKKPPHRGGALLNQPVPRPKASRRDNYHEHEYDEELDDFIDYDDEEDQGDMPPQYHYESDGSSDMEAGLDELDVEERQAERIAKIEDIKEQRLEQSLKAAKEERKRKALQDLRAKHR